MGWFGLLGGLFGTLAGLASDGHKERQANEILKQVEEDKKRREEETTWTVGPNTFTVAPTKDLAKVTPDYSAPLWEDPYYNEAAIDMEEKIVALGKKLPALYKAIDFQPIENGYSFLLFVENPEYTDFILTEQDLKDYRDLYYGMEFRPKDYNRDKRLGESEDRYTFGFVSECVSINNTPEATTIKELTKSFGLGLSTVGETLNLLRDKYIKPNVPRFNDWCKNELPKYGYTEKMVNSMINGQVITIDNPTNDIIYRNAEEKKFYDEVADRIMAISDRMCHYAINYFMLRQCKQPTRAFYDPYYNKYTYGTWKAKDSVWNVQGV